MENSPSVSKHETDEELSHRAIAPEANQLHGKNLPPERIGQVLFAADLEAGMDKKGSKNVTTISRSELLDMSEEITVDNTTLRHIYDTHLIGENGLRRLVHEQMHGGDLQEALRREILEHETDFERDPKLRGQSMRSGQQSSSINLRDLLAKAGIVETGSDNNRSQQPAKTKREQPAQGHLEKHLLQQAQQRKLLDFAFVGIILILLILVILLALSRG